MQIIKLNAIGSTNSFLKELSAEKQLEDYTVVIAESQTKGRGQMGTKWSSESGKNLTISVFKDVSFVNIEQRNAVSMVVAVALLKTLESFSIPNLKIKWPNDILSAHYKVAGILIENILKNNKLGGTVIGIGLNVNQTYFKDLPQASSMKLVTGKNFELEEILHVLLSQLQKEFELFKTKGFSTLKKKYESYLFRKDKPSTFKQIDGTPFTGYIKGISDSGCLRILIEDDQIVEFDHKTISLLY